MYFSIHQQGTQYFWAVAEDNHELLAHSELLPTKTACLRAIRHLQLEAGLAAVDDTTEARRVRVVAP